MGKILIIDPNVESCDNIAQFFSGLDHATSHTTTYTTALHFLENEQFDVVILDAEITVETLRFLVEKIHADQSGASLILLFSGTRNIQEELGAAGKLVFRALQKPFYDAELHFQVKHALESRAEEAPPPEDSGDSANLYSEYIGQSPAIERVFQIIGKTAKMDVNVIILGETGTGKELVARTLHRESLRAQGPFVSVNCAALPEQLLESELFGYEKGAFTGADRTRVGRFEHANGGTIFLDEVADMSLVTQAKLLRVLQQREFERLGSNISVKTDVRIVSATNRDLVKMMREGHFREDLFYRLNVVTIRLPPLRDRGGDIALLLAYFLKRSCAKMRKHVSSFSKDALDILTSYRWPGNIREMENTLDRAVLMANGDTVTAEDLDLFFTGPGASSCAAGGVCLPEGGITLAEAERQLIEQALERCGGSQKKAAELLGISGRVMNYKLKNLERMDERE